MKYYWSEGGNNNPDFTYRFTVHEVTPEMYKWCEQYPLDGPFERWHIRHRFKTLSYQGGTIEIPLIQFESKKAAYMFKLAFSEHILKDYSFFSIYD